MSLAGLRGTSAAGRISRCSTRTRPLPAAPGGRGILSPAGQMLVGTASLPPATPLTTLPIAEARVIEKARQDHEMLARCCLRATVQQARVGTAAGTCWRSGPRAGFIQQGSGAPWLQDLHPFIYQISSTSAMGWEVVHDSRMGRGGQWVEGKEAVAEHHFFLKSQLSSDNGTA